MAVLKTTSPVRSTGAPKLLPSKTVPSSRARTAGFNWACSSRFGGKFYLTTVGGFRAAQSGKICIDARALRSSNALDMFILFDRCRHRRGNGAVHQSEFWPQERRFVIA